MLSRDLRTLAAVLMMKADPATGDVVVPFADMQNITTALVELVRQAEAMEAVIVPAAARAIPDGVVDFSAERARRMAV